MEKRLSTTAMLFSIGFLFMLSFAVGAFFYGVKIGSEQMEKKYAVSVETADASAASGIPYQQQDLVSFYLTVYTPFREFQNDWFAALNQLSQDSSVDASALYKKLSKLAKQKSEEASSFDMGRSPLLGEAQRSYIRSLQFFQEASDGAAQSAKSKPAAELAQSLLQESKYINASKEALSAQRAYYNAMQKWAASVDPEIQSDYELPDLLSIKDWSDLPLTIKNRIIAEYLEARNELTPFYPHDLTSGVDEFIASGQAAKMKLQTLPAITDLLLNTNAIRSGDYTANKSRLYSSETLPQLPFFFPNAG